MRRLLDYSGLKLDGCKGAIGGFDKLKFALLCLVAVLAVGCIQRSSAGSATSGSAGCMDDRAAHLDSIVCGEGCIVYTCYFMEGTRNKKALENILNVVYGSFAVDVDHNSDPRSIDRYRKQLLDSLSSLEWLDSEPWPTVRSQFMAWTKQQLDRYHIVSEAKQDPTILYHCSETDSVLVRCADILSRGGDGYVKAVRGFLKESELAKAARDSVLFDRAYLKYTFSQIDRALDDPDSLFNARERLFILLGNHINHKIHNRLGENGTVDFYKYSDDFLRIFDSIKVETYEP